VGKGRKVEGEGKEKGKGGREGERKEGVRPQLSSHTPPVGGVLEICLPTDAVKNNTCSQHSWRTGNKFSEVAGGGSRTLT